MVGVEVEMFAAGGFMRSKRHILGPSVSRIACMINLPAELWIKAQSWWKVTVQPASQNTLMLRRLLATVGMTRPASVPGGRLGKLSDAVVDELIRSPLAMLTARE